MDIESMRREITKAYPGEKWAKRVRNMSAEQVTAVYLSFQEKKKRK